MIFPGSSVRLSLRIHTVEFCTQFDAATRVASLHSRRRASLYRGRAGRCAVSRRLIRRTLRADRCDADHAARARRNQQARGHCVHARLPPVQPQMAMGVGCGRRAAADPWTIGTACLVVGARRDTGGRRGRKPRARGSEGQSHSDCGRGHPGCDRWRHLRHRDRRLSHRIAGAASTRRRLWHVAVWLANRFGGGRRPGAGDRCAMGVGNRVYRLRCVRPAGDAWSV